MANPCSAETLVDLLRKRPLEHSTVVKVLNISMWRWFLNVMRSETTKLQVDIYSMITFMKSSNQAKQNDMPFMVAHIWAEKKTSSGEWVILGDSKWEEREMRSRRGIHKRLWMDSEHLHVGKQWSETNVAKCSHLTKLVEERYYSLYFFLYTGNIS